MTRARTGIQGFDEMLGGGLMRNDAIMVAGPAGSGKTTLGLEFLINGITRYGENGIYVTFEEMPDQIYRDATNLGWDIKKLEDAGQLRIICTSPHLITASGPRGGILDDTIDFTKAKRIVVDSLSHLEMYVGEKEFRPEAYKLVRYLKRKGLTSLLLWEASPTHGQSFGVTEVGLSFLVDCVIVFRFVEISSSMRRALGVVKMRGSKHDAQLREFMVDTGGIKLSDSFEGYEGIMSGNPRKLTVMDEAVERFSQPFASKRKRA